MTTLALSGLLLGAPRLLSRLLDYWTAFIDGIDDARDLAHRYETLARLSDAELAALGLKRQDIPRAVIASSRI